MARSARDDGDRLTVLIPADRIRRRVAALGRAITAEEAGRPLMVVPLLDGSFCFVADLVRRIRLPDIRLHFARASSYRGGTASLGTVHLSDLPDCRGQDVLVVDDILDTGRTLAVVTERLREAGAGRIRTCVLLDKPARRQVDIQADHVGFTIDDHFVVGYGLDWQERYRHLPEVHVLKQPG